MRAGLLSLGLLSAACAAFGYDFDEYQAAGTAGSAGTSAAGARARSTETGFAEGGERSQKEPVLTEGAGAGGETCAGAAGESHGGSGLITTLCEPTSCFDAAAQCGAIDDGCGQSLDCGPCFWWFETCQDNLCIILDSPSE